MTPMKARKRHLPVGIRRGLALVAVTAMATAAWHITDQPIGIGAINLVPGATADPTGPTGGPGGGMTDGGGSQFQPPSMPNSVPDYQGGNQPPLDQSNGISIYNSGAPKRGSNQVSKVASQHNRARSNPNTAHSLRTTKLPPPTPRVLVRLILNIKHHNKIRRNRVRSSSHKISSRVMLPHQRSSRPKLRTVNFRVVHGQRLRSNPVSLKLKTVQLDSCRAEFSRRR